MTVGTEFLGFDLPGLDAVPVTPDNANDLPGGAGVLVVSVGGTLQVDVIDRQGVRRTRALTVPAGLYPCRVFRVWSTNTAATGISVIYN